MENNTAPFEVGDEVVCVDDSFPDGDAYFDMSKYIKKGGKYSVFGVEKAPCKCWLIDVGIRDNNSPDGWVLCTFCNDIYWESGPVAWVSASRFRKILPYSKSLSQELAQQALKEIIEIDVPLKVLQN